MASVTLYKSFSFAAAQDWAWNIVNYPTSSSFSQITISDGTHTQVFKGSLFSGDGENVTGGTVTETQYKLNGALVYKVTGMSASGAQMQIFAETYGDTQAGYAYALRGNDTINGSSGTDMLNGYNGSDTVKGNGGNDVINGGAGNDVLVGAAGKDMLTGGSGADKFLFNTTPNATTNVDIIKDFSVSTGDLIQLENAIFTKLTATGVLKVANFKASTSGNAVDANDYILYETDTGKLFYDLDGSGAGAKVQFALLGTSTHPAITAADFVVI